MDMKGNCQKLIEALNRNLIRGT